MASNFFSVPLSQGLGYDPTVTVVIDGVSDNTVILDVAETPTLDIGEIIYFQHSTVSIPMYFISTEPAPPGSNYLLVSFDNRIYQSPAGLSNGYWTGYTKEAAIDTSVPNYSIESEVSRAVYSIDMIEYSKKNRYSINVRGIKRRYLSDFQVIANASTLFIGDDCAFDGDGAAYKVVLLEDSFDAFNNKFTKDLTFKVANV